MPPEPDSHAPEFLMLKRLDRVETQVERGRLAAAEEAGITIEFVEDGDLAMSASIDTPGPAFNHSSGLAQYPNLIPMVTDFYDRAWHDRPAVG